MMLRVVSRLQSTTSGSCGDPTGDLNATKVDRTRCTEVQSRLRLGIVVSYERISRLKAVASG